MQFSIDDRQLKPLFLRWRKNIIDDYLDIFDDPNDVDERRVVTIAVELACFDLVQSPAITVHDRQDDYDRQDVNFATDDVFFKRLVRGSAKIAFALYYTQRRLELLLKDVDPDLVIASRFEAAHLYEIETAIANIEAEPEQALRVLDWLALRALIDRLR